LASSSATLNDFTFSQMSLYVFLSFYVSIFTRSGSNGIVGDEVKSETIAMRLLKPISFSATYLYEELGRKIIQIVMISVPILGGILLFQFFNSHEVPFNLVNFVLFFVSSALAYLLNFYFKGTSNNYQLIHL
jgi:ABC-2 type transport system permease protein